MKHFFLFSGMMLAATWAICQMPATRAAAMQGLLNTLVDSQLIFGTTVRIQSGDGSLEWTGAAGNLTTETPYFIASTTKLCVTAVTLKLRAAGKLSLDDAAAKYLAPELLRGIHVYKGIDYSNQLTIRQLLAHTSGLPDYFQGKPVGEKSLEQRLVAGMDQAWDEAWAMELVAVPDEAAFCPRQQSQSPLFRHQLPVVRRCN